MSSVPFARKSRVFGHFRAFKTDVLGTLTDIASHGAVVRFRLLWADNYLVSDPELADHVYLNKCGSFIKNPYFWGRHKDVFGNGLLVSEGEHWKTSRKLVAPAFRKEAVFRYFDHAIPLVDDEIKRLSGAPFDLRQAMLRVTSRVATQALFGTVLEPARTQAALACLEDQFSQRMKRPFVFQDRLPTQKNRAFRAAIATLHAELALAIEQARDSAQPTALAALVRGAEEGTLTLADVRDEAITLFLAGHETTATALTFAIALLADHPEELQAAQDQARSLWRLDRPSLADLLRCEQLVGVIKETLRMFPPAYLFGRLTTQDAKLGGYTIPAGKTVVISPYVLGHRADLFPIPERFEPSRWTSGFEAALPRAAFSPFGGGPRICAGEHFAYLQMLLVLSRFLATGRPRIIESAMPRVSPWITLLPARPVMAGLDE